MSERNKKQTASRFKKTLRMVETSGGKNLAHSPVKKGVNKGDTAGGEWGILPNSLKMYINQAKNRNMPVDPRLEELALLPNDQITKRLNEDREIDNIAANLGQSIILDQADYDEGKAAYSWNHGNIRDFNNMPEGYMDNSYTQKYFNNLQEPDPIEEPVQMPSPIPNPPTPIEDVPGTFSKTQRLLKQKYAKPQGL